MLNRANLAAACFVELRNKTCEEDFSSLKAMHEHMQKMEKKEKKKKIANESSEESYDSEDDKEDE